MTQTPSFLDLGVSRPVVDALARNQILAPFAIQALVMEDALAGHDVLAKSKTGSGKTLGFSIPIVERLEPSSPVPSALVLVPTRELAQQVSEDIAPIAKARGLKVGVAYGGVSINEQAKGAAKAHILIATPGRLLDLHEQKILDLRSIQILIMDEVEKTLLTVDLGIARDFAGLCPDEGAREAVFAMIEAEELGKLAHRLRSAQRQRCQDRELGGLEAVTAQRRLEVPGYRSRGAQRGETAAVDAVGEVDAHGIQCRYTYRGVKQPVAAVCQLSP